MGGGSKGETKTSKTLSKIAEAFFTETTPVRQELTSQMSEALTTGGVGARMPIISKSQEASRQATSNALRALDAQLAQTGQAGTPFGTRARAETTQRGEMATARIPTDIVSQLLQIIPGFIMGQSQQAVSGLGQAGQMQASQASAQAQFLQAMSSMFGVGAGICDRRLKKNIKRIGTFNDIPLYEFEYLWSSNRYVGPMAQDLLKIKPEAVIRFPSGYYGINLNMI